MRRRNRGRLALRPISGGSGDPTRVAWVLAGGGARGAYEVGVCDYIFDEVARDLGGRVPLDILSGTSVGALHACALAAGADDPRAATQALIRRWTSLTVDQLVHLDGRRTFDMIRALVGRPPRPRAGEANRGGILDPRPLEALLSKEVDFSRVARHVASGRLHAVSVSTTHVASGRSTVFFQGNSDTAPWVRPRTWAYPIKLTRAHALASAAIPFLFPAVRIRGALYCDGSLRQHVPLSPARRLGAQAMVVINPGGPSSTVEAPGDPARESSFPDPVFLLGKVLNALSLDRVDADVERLELVNALLAAGVHQYGPAFVDRLNEQLAAAGRPRLLPIPLLYVRASQDLGKLSADYVRARSFRSRRRGVIDRVLAGLAQRGSSHEADLLSYLLFDGPFARALIDLGRRDARARHDEIVGFFRRHAGEAGAPAAA